MFKCLWIFLDIPNCHSDTHFVEILCRISAVTPNQIEQERSSAVVHLFKSLLSSSLYLPLTELAAGCTLLTDTAWCWNSNIQTGKQGGEVEHEQP